MVFDNLKFPQFYLAIAGLILSGFFPGSVSAGVPLDRIVAVINDDVIMQSELEYKINTVIRQILQQEAQRPPRDVLEEQVLERMIINKLQLQQADTNGIKVDDQTLNETINKIATDNRVTLTQFREILEKDGIDYEQFREDIRDEITIARLRQRQVANRVSVTEREIDNFLVTEEVQGVGNEPEYRISHILVATPESATAEEIEQAKLVGQKILDDLQSGISFEELAKTVSDGQQSESGGDLGWRKENDIPELFAEKIRSMKEGDVSDLITSSSGIHIIKLTAKRNTGKHLITQTKARHILIRPNELISDEDARIRLEQLVLRIQGGDDFAELAKAHSEDPGSAVNGGELGWASPGTMVPEFEEQMNNLQVGELSEPFQTEFGWHIVQVLERREYDNSEDLKRNRAREIIQQRKITEAQQNWIRDLRDAAYVEYRLNDY